MRHTQETKFNSFASYSKKKSSILWKFILEKNSILWVMKKKIQFFEWFSKISSIEIFDKNKRVQFCESYSKKKSWILWVNFFKKKMLWVVFLFKKFNSLSFFFFSKNGFNFFESCWKEGFNSLRFFSSESRSKRVQLFDSFSKSQFFKSNKKKGSTLQVILKIFEFFESYWKSSIEKCSILWVIFWKKG